MTDDAKQDQRENGVGSRKLVRRFGYRPHTNPRIIAAMPNELEVGWHFTDASGRTLFVKWGSTKNKETLMGVIADVQKKHGPMEVMDLSLAK